MYFMVTWYGYPNMICLTIIICIGKHTVFSGSVHHHKLILASVLLEYYYSADSYLPTTRGKYDQTYDNRTLRHTTGYIPASQ